MPHPKEITLASLGGGALMELVTMELRKIGDNIADPNIQTEAKRKLQINIEIKPDPKGEMASLTYNVKTSMPGPSAGKAIAYIAKASGESAISFFEVETQPPLFGDEESSVTPLASAKRA